MALPQCVLTCKHVPGCLASPQVAGCGLDSCAYRELQQNECEPEEGSDGAVLSIMSAAADGLPVLLRALRPGRWTALHRLELFVCPLDAAVLEHCAELATVTQLGLEHCSSGDWEAAMAALLCRAPLLSSLLVLGCFHGALPRCLTEYTGLRRLALLSTGLQVLPAGPYLSRLRQLTLSEDSLQQLPPALTAATALTSLEVRRSGLAEAPLRADSLAAALAQLSRLQRLELRGCDLHHLPAAGDWPGVSALQVLTLSSSSLAVLHRRCTTPHLCGS